MKRAIERWIYRTFKKRWRGGGEKWTINGELAAIEGNISKILFRKPAITFLERERMVEATRGEDVARPTFPPRHFYAPRYFLFLAG